MYPSREHHLNAQDLHVVYTKLPRGWTSDADAPTYVLPPNELASVLNAKLARLGAGPPQGPGVSPLDVYSSRAHEPTLSISSSPSIPVFEATSPVPAGTVEEALVMASDLRAKNGAVAPPARRRSHVALLATMLGLTLTISATVATALGLVTLG